MDIGFAVNPTIGGLTDKCYYYYKYKYKYKYYYTACCKFHYGLTLCRSIAIGLTRGSMNSIYSD